MAFDRARPFDASGGKDATPAGERMDVVPLMEDLFRTSRRCLPHVGRLCSRTYAGELVVATELLATVANGRPRACGAL